MISTVLSLLYHHCYSQQKMKSFDRNTSDGKASLKRQKLPETTTDTQGMNKFLLILCVKCSYFEIFIVINQPYFIPHTIP